MTTSVDISALKGTGVSTAAQARAAVKEFRRLQPTLNSYARNLTGRRDVTIEMAVQDNGSTDGKRIFYRPPMALGLHTDHQRSICGKRDPSTGEQRCLACRAREDTLVTVYHEIAHICFESFAKVDIEDAAAVAEAARAAGGPFADAIADRIRSAPTYLKRSYIALCNVVSPFMPLLWNALEDARVNEQMFKARPGTKVMFDTNTQKIFREGVEQVDPDNGEIITKMWNTYPLNMQVLVGLFCKASGYTYEEWFAEQVVTALNDAEVTELVNRLSTVRSAAGVYSLSFPLLKRLRELGFCISDEDPPEPEPEPEPEPDEEEDAPSSEDADESHDASDPTDGPESGDSEGQGGPAEDDQPPVGETPDSSGGGGEEEGDPESDGDEDGSGSPGSEDGTDPADDAESGDGEADEGGEGGGLDGDASSDDQPDDAERSDGDPSGNGVVDGAEEVDADSMDEGNSSDADGTQGEGDIEGDALEHGTGGQASAASGEDQPESGSEEDGDAAGSTGDAGEEAEGLEADSGDQEGGRSDDESRSPSGDEAAESDDAGVLGEDDPIDTGADTGTGGTMIEEDSSNDDTPIEMGTPEEVKTALLKFGDHEEKPKTLQEKAQEEAENKALEVAIVQGMYFETPSRNIVGVREHRWGAPVIQGGFNFSQAWDEEGFYAVAYGRRSGLESDTEIPEAVLGPALLRMRVAFSDNERGSHKEHLKSGRINGRVLGKRAHLNDPRLFRKKVSPGKKSYFVILGMDVSGSTVGRNIILEKRAVMAQAQLCQRMGIPFAIYAHSGNFWNASGGRSNGLALDVYLVKEPDEPWDKHTKERLTKLGPDSANLDGHFLEYLRKVADKRPETDKIIMYYSDGKMPAENHDEELEILRREIATCKQKSYTLMGVGIRTDSPARHGLDTVQVDEDEHIAKVVRHLEKRLLAK